MIDQCSCDTDPLLHAPGQLPGQCLLKIFQSDHFDMFRDQFFLFLRRKFLMDSKRDIFFHGKPWKQSGFLEHHPDMDRWLLNPLSADFYLTICRFFQSGDHARKRTLSTSARPNDTDEFSCADFQIDIRKHLKRNIFDLKYFLYMFNL